MSPYPYPSALTACTIVEGRKSVPARALADSFLTHHAGSTVVILVTDAEPGPSMRTGLMRWIGLADLGLTKEEIHHLAAAHDADNLAVIVKPLLLRRLLDESPGPVVFAAPDTYFYGALDAFASSAGAHELTMVPYTTEPSLAHVAPPLARGVFNTRLFAATQAARPFLDWWWDTTRASLADDPSDTAALDQRLLDTAVAFFAPFIVRAAAYGVGHWNLHGRSLTQEGSSHFINGEPLRTFHFDGFDSSKPWLLNAREGRHPFILLSEYSALDQLCADYVATLEGLQTDQNREIPYGWDALPSNVKMNELLRRIYREGAREAARGNAPSPPDPFDTADAQAFIAWLNAPSPDGPRYCSRYLHAIYRQRSDLQVHFPDIHYRDRRAFMRWIAEEGVTQEEIPPQLVPRISVETHTVPTLAPGVTLAGYFRAELGIGEAGRLLAAAVEAAGIAHATVTYDVSASRQSHDFAERSADAAFDVNLLCVNAVSMLRFAGDVGPEFFAGRHTIGYWFWELEHFPASMHGAFDLVDEVWVADDFVAQAIRAAGRKPVFTIPLPLSPQVLSPTISRERLNLPDRFVFLSTFDFLSVMERKNPLGLIRAFATAFAPDEGPVLLLKTINGHLRLDELERVRAAAAGRADIRIVDGYYSPEEKTALIGHCDCSVSLHRSEGLGLTLAEAMAAGRPVIATGYSGNLHFMTSENSYLVDFVLSSVPQGVDPYPAGTVWATPDLDHAARLMREVYHRPEAAAQKAAWARADLLQHHNVRQSADAIVKRLAEIRRQRSAASGRAAVSQESSTRVLADAALTRMSRLARPTISVEGRRLADVRSLAQRALLRVLRPYWTQQTQFNEAAIAALTEMNSALERHAKHTEETQAHTHELQQSLLARSASLGDHLLKVMARIDRNT